MGHDLNQATVLEASDLKDICECYDTVMKSLQKTSMNQTSTAGAKEMVEVWQEAQEALEVERLQRLRSLSERDAARQFAQMLQIQSPYPLRPSSGLVEQQRLLAPLRTQR